MKKEKKVKLNYQIKSINTPVAYTRFFWCHFSYVYCLKLNGKQMKTEKWICPPVFLLRVNQKKNVRLEFYFIYELFACSFFRTHSLEYNIVLLYVSGLSLFFWWALTHSHIHTHTQRFVNCFCRCISCGGFC